MKHIDEHILELFVLNAKEIRSQKRSIQNHLRQCAGCREVVRQFEQIYAELDRRLLESDEPVPDPGKQIVTVFEKPGDPGLPIRSVEENVKRYVRILSDRNPDTLPIRLNSFRREHPIASSSISLVLLAIVGLSLYYLLSPAANPAYYYYNTNFDRVEVYSSANKLLWSVHASGLVHAKELEASDHVAYTMAADLDSDGKNDVLTSLLVGDEVSVPSLNIFSPGGKLMRTWRLPGVAVNFRDVRYETPLGAGGLLKEIMPDGSLDLFLTACVGDPRGGDRSPCTLWRLNTNLNPIGEYWHYGVFEAHLINASDRGSREIALVGSDDVRDMSGRAFEFMAILDPGKLIGSQESSRTRGFGHKVSDAELYYVRFPETDLDHAVGYRSSAAIVSTSPDGTFDVRLSSNWPDAFGFDYIFDAKDMTVQQVKFIGPTEQTYARLKSEGKVHGTFDMEYLENLKKRVRYWNGKGWVNRPTKLVHD